MEKEWAGCIYPSALSTKKLQKLIVMTFTEVHKEV